MRSFRLDPYLWVHLAGLAVVPLWLDICLLGLATGEPVLPVWTELGLISIFGSLPIVWMQWQKPFSIFSLVLLALRPDRMSDDRRRILRLFKDPIVKFLAALAPIPLIWALVKLYTLSPLVQDLSPFTAGGRGLGLLVAAIAFLLANLFVQVPLSVLRVLITPPQAFAKLSPYPAEQIKRDFTLLGFRVNRILPDWQAAGPAGAAPADAASPEVAPQPTAPTLEQDFEAWEEAVESASDPSTPDWVAGETAIAAVEPAATEAVEPEVFEDSEAGEAEPTAAELETDFTDAGAESEWFDPGTSEAVPEEADILQAVPDLATGDEPVAPEALAVEALAANPGPELADAMTEAELSEDAFSEAESTEEGVDIPEVEPAVAEEGADPEALAIEALAANPGPELADAMTEAELSEDAFSEAESAAAEAEADPREADQTDLSADVIEAESLMGDEADFVFGAGPTNEADSGLETPGSETDFADSIAETPVDWLNVPDPEAAVEEDDPEAAEIDSEASPHLNASEAEESTQESQPDSEISDSSEPSWKH